MKKTSYNKKYETSINGKFRYLKSSCKKRQIDLKLTKIEYAKIITNQPCFYCNNYIPATGSGLDRIDSNQGYTKKNVLPCCGECNRIKSDKYTIEETKVMIKALQKYRKKK